LGSELNGCGAPAPNDCSVLAAAIWIHEDL
jgi:hypothetical protein